MNKLLITSAAALGLVLGMSAAILADDATTQPAWKTQLTAGRDAERKGQYTDAETALKAAVAAAPDGTLDAAECLNELGKLYRLTAQYDQADQLDHQSLDLRTKLAGESDPLVAVTLENLGELDTVRGKYDAADHELRRALEIRKAALGDQSADTAETMTNLGSLDLCVCKFDEGGKLCQQAVDIQDKTLGDDDPARAWGWDNLATAYYFQSKLVDAETLLKRSLDLRTRVLGDDHPDVATSYDNLGGLYYAWGNPILSRRYFKLAEFTRENSLGPDHPDTQESAAMLAQVEEMDKDQFPPDRTAPVLEKSLALETRVLGTGHWITQSVQAALAMAYAQRNGPGDLDNAEKLLKQAVDESRKSFGETTMNTAVVESDLADFYTEQNIHLNDAETLYKQSLVTMERLFGNEDRNTGGILRAYSTLLKAEKRDAEAAPLAARADAIDQVDQQRNPLQQLSGPGL
ncbi:MAG: tetratricopeptide repeat protein [Tepidisphaeraceae bacterium]|jgi:tetratricopeptide (TPR) repeat protein